MSPSSRSRQSDPAPLERRFKAVLPAIFAVGLVARGIYLAEMSRQPFFELLLGDGKSYDAWARTIAAGDWVGQTTFYQAPLYPYFLGVLYAVFGRNLMLVRLVQALLGSLGCVLLALAGRRWLSPRVGTVAGFVLALYPPAIFFDGMIQKSALDLVFMTLLLWLLARIEDGPGAFVSAMAGVALGAFALTRENALVFLPVIAVWLLWRFRADGWGRAARATLLFAAGVAAILVPVGVRNTLVGGAFLLTTAQSGPNFYIGNHAGAQGRYVPLKPGREMPEYERRDATDLAEAALGRRLTPREVSDYWRDRALAWIRHDPWNWIALLARKTLLTWNALELPDTESLQLHRDHAAILRLLGAVLGFGVVAPWAVVGIAATWGERRRLAVLYLLLVSFTVAVALFYVFARYRYPLVPLLVLFASAGACAAWDAARRHDGPALGAGAAILAASALVAWWPLLPRSDSLALAYNNIGITFAEEKQFDRAVTYYGEALRIDPDEPEIVYNLAVARAAQGRVDEARVLYERVLAIQPENSAARDNLGVLLAQAGKLDEAEAQFEEALRLDPGSVTAQLNLGNLALLQGDAARAETHYRRAVAGAPGGVDPRLALARVLVETGRRAEAQALWREVLVLDPASEDARAALARAP